MLSLWLDNVQSMPIPIEDDRWYVTRKFDGLDTLTFEIDSNDPMYQYIGEEVTVEGMGNRYLIKNVDEHSTFVTVNCALDLDDWKQNVYHEFRRVNITLSEILDEIRPSGWTITGAGLVTIRTTVEDFEGMPLRAVVPFDILGPIASAYDVVFNYDVPRRQLTIVRPDQFPVSNEFLMAELNLRSVGYVGNSDGFATRLYAWGAVDEQSGIPLTFAGINNGVPYIEDFTFSDKVVEAGWTDERYHVQEHLLEAAQARLKRLSYPKRSYTCDVKNIRDSVFMYMVITLVDQRRKVHVQHQIVEYRQYELRPDLDVVTLSSTAPRLENQLRDMIQDANRYTDNQVGDIGHIIRNEVNRATDRITGNQGGSFRWLFDQQERPIELVNLGDTMDINTAQRVWRWNASGLGFSSTGFNGTYGLALTNDGRINADMITTGIMNANVIQAGTIRDVHNTNFWNLETGEFRLSPNVSLGNGPSLGEVLDDVRDSVSTLNTSLTQQEIFNRLTNNGSTMGIFMTGNQLFINGDFIRSGTVWANHIEATDERSFVRNQTFIRDIVGQPAIGYTQPGWQQITNAPSAPPGGTTATRVMRIEPPSAGTRTIFAMDFIPVEQGDVINLEIVYRYLNTDGTSLPRLVLERTNENQASVTTVLNPAVDTGPRTTAWTTMSARFTIPANVRFIRAGIRAEAAGANNMSNHLFINYFQGKRTIPGSMVTGTLSDPSGNTHWNLGTGVLTSNRFVLNSSNLTITQNGNLTATSGNFSGTITSTSGTIGGFTIGTSNLRNGPTSITADTPGVFLGTNGMQIFHNATSFFRVQNGRITARGASIYASTTDGANHVFLSATAAQVQLQRDHTNIGSIGTNAMANASWFRGLAVNLMNGGNYMAFAEQSTPGAATTTLRLTWARSAHNNIPANCWLLGHDLDFHNWQARRFFINQSNAENSSINHRAIAGGITGRMNFVQVRQMHSDGRVALWTTGCHMEFRNGVLISGAWGR